MKTMRTSPAALYHARQLESEYDHVIMCMTASRGLGAYLVNLLIYHFSR